MSRSSGTRPLFRLPWRTRSQIAADVDDELAFHLEMRARELASRGLPADAALAEARRRFGDLDYTRHYCRDEDQGRERATRRTTIMDELRQDLTYAIRALRSARGFTIVTLLTVAVGIGANTAIFSVVRGVLLQPLPFPQAEQLDRIWSRGTATGMERVPLSEPDFRDLRAAARSYQSMGAFWFVEGNSGIALTGLGRPEQLSAAYVTDGFFETLGARALLGRVTRPQEHVVGNDHVVVLSHGYWQRRFASDPAVIGRALVLDGVPHTVVGIMPPDVTFPAERLDLWVPLSRIPEDGIPRLRTVRFLGVIGRRAAGVTPQRAAGELTAIERRLAAQYPADDAEWKSATTASLRDATLGEVRRPLVVLLAAVGFLLLMTCANVAGLLLARATTRERELAVRAALGAGRGRIVRQLVTESLLLSVTGGALGVLLAVGGVRALLRLGASELPRIGNVQVDAAVLLFALGVSLVCGLLFGLAPALRAASVNLRDGLHSSGRGHTSASGQRVRASLVVAQVAVALVLAIGAGLATRSVARLLQVDPGYRPDHLLAVTFSIDGDRHPGEQRDAFYLGILDRVRALPGVVAAGAAKDLPLRGAGEPYEFSVPGFASQEVQRADWLMVSPDYFRALGIPFRAGRDFTTSDRRGTPYVVVVSDAFAKRYWPGERAIGRTVRLFGTDASVIGVVGDVRQRSLAEEPVPMAYLSSLQVGRSKVSLAVRTRGEPLRLAGAVREAIWSLDRDQPITSVTTLDDVVNQTIARPRLVAALLALFGAMGLALGALGLHGVLAYAVSQRRQEIGVRVALGATPRAVLGLVLRQGLALALLGIAIGVGAALAMTRYMQSLLYGVGATDPGTFAGVTLALLLVALVATLLPARRALRIAPMVAMRAE